MIKITLDTNCVINILDYKSPSSTSVEELSEIMRYALEGDVNLAITTRVKVDIKKDKDDERKEEFIKRIGIFPVIGTIFRLDMSELDSDDILLNDNRMKLQVELEQILFPNIKKGDSHYHNKISDIDHLIGHILNKRDIFVTDDHDILRKTDSLKSAPGITVMDPKSCLKYINLKANKFVIIQEFYEKLEEYKDFLIKVFDDGDYKKNQEGYKKIREWLIKKYPLIKDGILHFKHNMISVPVGGGQMMSDRRNLLGIQRINERIQELVIEPNLKKQIENLVHKQDNDYFVQGSETEPRLKIEEEFQDILDLFLSYSGYLEENK